MARSDGKAEVTLGGPESSSAFGVVDWAVALHRGNLSEHPRMILGNRELGGLYPRCLYRVYWGGAADIVGWMHCEAELTGRLVGLLARVA